MKFFFIRKRWIKPLTVFAAIGAAAAICISMIVSQHSKTVMSPGNDKLPIYCVATQDKKVAVTFDAAWGSDSTEGILELLDEYNTKCTFFLVSYWVDKNENLIKTITDRGHEIGSHSSTHPHMSGMSREKTLQELEANRQKITALSGQPVTLFRPPFGDYDAKLVQVAKEAGFSTIQWDVDSLDWKGLNANAILGRVKAKTGNGSIILFHNNSENILSGLKATLEYLAAEGYEMVKVSDLIHPDPYTLDHEGRQHAVSDGPHTAAS